MSIECKCEPCPVDIRVLGYKTRKEDPAFEGTECEWHEVIASENGKRKRMNDTNGKALRDADGECIYASSICVAGGTEDHPIFALDNDGAMIEFGFINLQHYAKQIGAKRA